METKKATIETYKDLNELLILCGVERTKRKTVFKIDSALRNSVGHFDYEFPDEKTIVFYNLQGERICVLNNAESRELIKNIYLFCNAFVLGVFEALLDKNVYSNCFA